MTAWKVIGIILVILGFLEVLLSIIIQSSLANVTYGISSVFIGIVVYMNARRVSRVSLAANSAIGQVANSSIAPVSQAPIEGDEIAAYLLKNMLNIGSTRGMLKVTNDTLSFIAEDTTIVMNEPLNNIKVENKIFPAAYLSVTSPSKVYKYVFTAPGALAISSGFTGETFTERILQCQSNTQSKDSITT